MKVVKIGMVCLVLVASVSARTWTNTEGKTLEADLVRIRGDEVFLQLSKNRKIVPLPIDKLSEADKQFLEEHQKEIEERVRQQKLDARKVRWHEDWGDAVAESEETGYPILFLYTAPEWCGYCVVLEDNILDKSEFKDYAKRNLVYYIADFSKKSDGEKWKKKNGDLAKKFPCSGYPCTYIVSPQGEKLGKIGGCDREWKPKDYIAKIEKFKAKM